VEALGSFLANAVDTVHINFGRLQEPWVSGGGPLLLAEGPADVIEELGPAKNI
jgi:hypothetical protein